MFNLENHLQEHAIYFQKYADITKKDLHFNFSFLDLQFLEKDIQNTLEEFIRVIREPAAYSVKNGIRKNKKGDVQKYTKRKINLAKDIKIEAIHVEGPEGEDTMPHIHLVANSNSRWGQSYSLLKKHISEVTKRFNLLANFDTLTEYNPKAIKQLSKAVNQITWGWKQGNQLQFKKSIENKSLKKELDLLHAYTLQTHNLSYYIKSMNQIQSRLNRSKSNFMWEGHNLEDTYPIPLTQEDFTVIDLIRNKKFQEEDIAPYINNPILRDYVRYTENLTEPFILNAIKKQTNLLKGIRKNRSVTRSYLNIMKNTPTVRVNDNDFNTKMISRTHIINKDILQALKAALTSATNTNSLVLLMQNAGYSDFQFIKSKQKVTACLYIESKRKYTIKLNDIGMSWEKIQDLLKDNLFKFDLGEDLSNKNIDKQVSLSDYIQDIKPNLLPIIEPIQYKAEEIKKKKEKATSKAKENRADEKKYQSGISELTYEIERLERNIENINTGLQQVSEIRTDIEELERNIRESNTGIRQIPSIETKLEQCKENITNARREESELTAGIEELKSNIRESNTGVQQIPDIESELKECKTNIAKSRTRESNLSSEIEKLKRNIKIANTRIHAISRIKKEFEQCETDIATARTKESKLSSEIEGLENGDYEKFFYNKLKDKIESVEREIETIESANQELKIPSLLSQSEDDNATIDEFVSAKVK